MARTRQGALLTDLQLRQQLGLRAATVRDIIKLYPIWDLADPASYERFVNAVIVLTQAWARNSAALAARYYEMFRNIDTGLTWGKAAVIAEPPTAEQIRIAVAATARAGVYRSLAVGKTVEQARRSGLVQLTGSTSRLVLNGGRDTILENVERDPEVIGWIRVSDGDPCAFCAMLLGRGPVYKEESADFEAHDHCACGAEPFVENSKWPSMNQRLHDQWNEARASKDKGADPYTNWRQFYEGRGKYAPEE